MPFSGKAPNVEKDKSDAGPIRQAWCVVRLTERSSFGMSDPSSIYRRDMLSEDVQPDASYPAHTFVSTIVSVLLLSATDRFLTPAVAVPTPVVAFDEPLEERREPHRAGSSPLPG